MDEARHCAGCSLSILDRYVFKVLDKSWHEACIRCSDCGCLLVESCFSRDGLLLCKNDFSRRYMQRCAGCKNPLAKDDLVRRAKDKVFHVHCFQCSVCQRTLATGEQLYIVDGNLFVCQEDFKCGSTSAPPVPTPSKDATSEDESTEATEENALDDDGELKGDEAAAKRRGPRTTIKAKQLELLKEAFARTPKPTRHIREELAQQTGLNMRVIQVWFQNRRSKERRLRSVGNMRSARRSRGGRNDMFNEASFFAPSTMFYDYETPFMPREVHPEAFETSPPIIGHEFDSEVLLHSLPPMHDLRTPW